MNQQKLVTKIGAQREALLSDSWESIAMIAIRARLPVRSVVRLLHFAAQVGLVECRLPELGAVTSYWRRKQT